MARFNASEADRYGGTGGAGYFSLKNDKDTARVRFMYNGIEDVEGFAVHEVMVGDKKRYVNCLREYGQPLDTCPFCAEQQFQKAKFFIPIYNVDEDKVQIWDRGKQFVSKISSICARYPDLVSHIFEVERNGKPGSTSTTYEIYEIEQDGTTMEDLPEAPQILGGLILDKTFEEMSYYLDYGSFPETDEEEAAPEPRQSRNSRSDVPDRRPAAPAPAGRRTPANASRGRGDRF